MFILDFTKKNIFFKFKCREIVSCVTVVVGSVPTECHWWRHASLCWYERARVCKCILVWCICLRVRTRTRVYLRGHTVSHWSDAACRHQNPLSPTASHVTPTISLPSSSISFPIVTVAFPFVFFSLTYARAYAHTHAHKIFSRLTNTI